MSNNEDVRRRIIGLGENSWRKSYFPELKQKLQELEDFKTMVNQSQDIILILEKDFGKVRDHNQAALDFLSQGRSEIKGLTIEELFPENEAKIFLKQLRLHDHSRFQLTFKQGLNMEKTIEFTLTRQLKEGRMDTIALGRDISIQMEYQRALQESENRLELALQGGGLGLWDLDLKKNKLITNDLWYTMLGYETQKPQPSYELWKSLLHPEDMEETEELLASHIRGESDFYRAEFRMKTADGKWKWILSRGKVSSRSPEGRALRITGTHQDINQLRAMEERIQQVQKLESIGRLAGGIAHDFNNILTVISMESEILMEELKTFPHFMEDVKAIYDAGERGAMLTRQLLAFSRKQQSNPSLLNLGEIIEKLKDMMDRLLGSDVKLELSIDADLPKILYDKSQLEQVLINLMVNSRDAMQNNPPERERLLVIRARRRTEDVLLEVEDLGEGIPKDIQHLIFDPFFTTKREEKGTGLGLATVFGIVSQNGGTITFESKENQGSRFFITIPIHEEAAP